jgi:hypothetical protein
LLELFAGQEQLTIKGKASADPCVEYLSKLAGR